MIHPLRVQDCKECLLSHSCRAQGVLQHVKHTQLSACEDNDVMVAGFTGGAGHIQEFNVKRKRWGKGTHMVNILT